MKIRLFLFYLSILLFSSPCSNNDKACQGASDLSRPVQTDDGWQTTSLDSVGIHPEKLEVLVRRGYVIQAIIISTAYSL